MDDVLQLEYGFYSDMLVECHERFGSVFDLPIIKNPYVEIKQHYLSGNVLDVGAGKTKPLLQFLESTMKGGSYYSMDTDQQGDFTYSKIEDIPSSTSFDLIVANQIFEHLSVNSSLAMIRDLSRLLSSGGKIIATVPNIAHPNRQHSNITHITPWGYNSLYMLFRHAGLSVLKIARYSKRHPKGIIEKTLSRYIARIYRMDWCDSIIIVAER